ncbi:MAG: hypothetical protein HYZ29_11765 [Myxococcales bacterium]|nr:hypothetical protein [Myxococcales bacterium]
MSGETVQPNGVATSFTYNDTNQLKDVAIKNVSGTTLASYAYTLSATGNRTGVTEGSGRTIAWTYDKLYRLTSETISGAATANGAISYTYDAVGNRLTRTSSVTGVPSATTSYDANDRTVGDSWNDNGNMLTRDGRTHSFDSLDRLVSSTAGTSTVKVTYDGDGNRVSQEVGGVVTTYLVDDQNPTGYAQVVEERVAGSVAKAWVFGARPLSQRAKSGSTWTTSYYGLDGHGSVVLLTSDAGSVTDTWEYEAFGTVVARTGTTENAILYSGEWMDSAQGLQYLRARWYAPGMGRFVSGDTYEGDDEDADSHRYTYTSNSPIGRRDPSGNTTLVELNASLLIQGVLLDIRAAHTTMLLAVKDEVVTSVQDLLEVDQGLTADESAGLFEHYEAGLVDFAAVLRGFTRSFTPRAIEHTMRHAPAWFGKKSVPWERLTAAERAEWTAAVRSVGTARRGAPYTLPNGRPGIGYLRRIPGRPPLVVIFDRNTGVVATAFKPNAKQLGYFVRFLRALGRVVRR